MSSAEGQTAGPTLGMIFSAADLETAEFPEPRWAVPGILPVGLALLAGKPKIGKSWLALALGIGIGLGGAVLGKIRVDPGDALYLALEDRRQRLKGRMRKLREQGKWPARLFFSTDCPRMGMGGIETICGWLNDHKEARLVIIDTLPKFRRRVQGGARNQYDEDYQTGEALKAVADHYAISILVICHLRKMDAEDPFDTISGTIGLSGSADTNIVITRARGQSEATLCITGRDVDEDKIAMKWDAVLATWAIVGSAEEYARTKERRDLVRVLLGTRQAMTAKEVAAAVDKKPENVRQLLYAMAQDGEVVGVGEGRYMARAVYSDAGNTGNTGNSHYAGSVTAVTDVTSVTGVTTVTGNAHSEGNGAAGDSCAWCGKVVACGEGHMGCRECRDAQHAALSAPGEEEAET